MSGVTEFFSSVFWGVVVLSVLVFVHEGGHFLVARAFGTRVTEFFLGLPSRYRLSWKSRRFGTEFGVTPFLLGGYNRICGMEGNQDELLPDVLAIVQREGSVRVHSIAKELGIDDNRTYDMLETLVDMASIRPCSSPLRDEDPYNDVYYDVFETVERDRSLRNEYDANHDFNDGGTTPAGTPRPVQDPQRFFEQERSRTYVGKPLHVRIATLLAGPAVNIIMAFVLLVGSFTCAGFAVWSNSNVLGDVTEGSLAEAAGIQAGDRITEIGGVPVTNWDELCEAVDSAFETQQDFTIRYERDSQTKTVTVDMPEDEKVEMLGVSASTEIYHPSIIEACGMAWSYVSMVGSTVAKIVVPTHTMEIVSQSSSIVGISAMASDAAASGPNAFLLFAAAISLSLGFMNLLPIPPLDGGKILLEIVQVVIRRPLSPRAQNAVSYVGLAFFLFIFCFAVRNDIMHLLGM